MALLIIFSRLENICSTCTIIWIGVIIPTLVSIIESKIERHLILLSILVYLEYHTLFIISKIWILFKLTWNSELSTCGFRDLNIYFCIILDLNNDEVILLDKSINMQVTVINCSTVIKPSCATYHFSWHLYELVINISFDIIMTMRSFNFYILHIDSRRVLNNHYKVRFSPIWNRTVDIGTVTNWTPFKGLGIEYFQYLLDDLCLNFFVSLHWLIQP